MASDFSSLSSFLRDRPRHILRILFRLPLVAVIFNSKRKHRGDRVPESIEMRSQKSLVDYKNHATSTLFNLTFEALSVSRFCFFFISVVRFHKRLLKLN